MARKIIDVGVIGNDGTGDSIRDSFRKVNDNFRELYSSLGLGERLTFTGLGDTPENYVGQYNAVTNNTPLVTINDSADGVTFKRLVAGEGIDLKFTRSTDPEGPNQIIIRSDFQSIIEDESPTLGGPLRTARAGLGTSWPILDLQTPTSSDQAVNKNYADSKISKAGIDAVNPESGLVDSSFGRMSGPLILSRNPEPEDDELYSGLIAATKSYVDSAAFGSVSNLFVAVSGRDERPGLSKELQGRALAYAFRTIEAACKRAEEIVLESREEIGPYEKTLTYDNGANECTLTSVTTSPSSGEDFEGTIRMSIDTVTPTTTLGSNYYPGDILTFNGGTGSQGTIEVLTTLTTPGVISTFRIISTGSYVDVLPGVTGVATTITTSGAPPGVPTGLRGGATFNLTYKVNSVTIVDGGTGYSLVSVRIIGGGGSGAFGTAVVVDGVVDSITITDQGSGFTSIPTLTVDLPRFSIFTDGLRTDFTGDVINDTPAAFRGRDIREGLYLKGKTSGALAQILSHTGELSGDDELFDVDIKFGAFQVGEAISYGDVTRNVQITILVESGIYEENLPLKVPQNTSIVGDEFRRVIVRPKTGVSASPWAFQKFRRDLTIGQQSAEVVVFDPVPAPGDWEEETLSGDQLNIATQIYGYHYLTDSSNPIYPKINNKGAYDSAAALIILNRLFIQEEIIAWITDNILAEEAPFSQEFVYNRGLYRKNIGLIIDAMVFDLRWSEYNRTVAAGLSYSQSSDDLEIITDQLDEYLAVIDRIEELVQFIISNNVVNPVSQSTFLQTIDPAFQAEAGSDLVITDLVDTLKGILTNLEDALAGNTSVINLPKNNDMMDMFLANDACRWQAITGQGHGGFMLVLDPTGQVLAKSPYAQECASFSKGTGKQTFAGGMFVDGFSGNLQFTIDTIVTTTRLEVTGLDRFPQLPCSFIVFDSVYRVNYVRDFVYDKDGSTATFVLDETTPWPFDIFEYNESACNRDVGLIIEGLGYDLVLGTNYNTRVSGSTYRMSQSAVVIADQREITIDAIILAHTEAKSAITTTLFDPIIDSSQQVITDIIDRGTSSIPPLTFTLPPGASANLTSAYNLLVSNLNFIKEEVKGWINYQIANDLAPWALGDTFNDAKSLRDTGLVIEAVIFDLLYGGNYATRIAALKYYNNLTGVGLLASGQPARCAAAITYAKTLAKLIIVNTGDTSTPGAPYSALSRTTGTAASASEQAIIETLMTAVAGAISINDFDAAQAAIVEVAPDLSDYAYNATAIGARTELIAAKSTIQTTVVTYVNDNGNRYELLMPGNRSMLANDYTQINDLGYGAIAQNGGLIELVSVFTYYCHISYYSVNGGQIRSISGSSAHGNYALVAEGADPLEVPTPTDLFEDISQSVTCYAPSGEFVNDAGDLTLYIWKFDYVPLNNSELEINHIIDGVGVIYRYTVTTVTIQGINPDPTTGLQVARINLGSGVGTAESGLFRAVPDGTKMTIRQGAQTILTGNLVNVAVRPSTGLKLRETPNTVYRVLQFTEYEDTNGPYEVLISNSSPAVLRVLATVTKITGTDTCTTSQNHKLKIGDKFIPTTTANGLSSGTTYYVIEIPEYNQFKLSTTIDGTAATLVNGTGLSIKGVKSHRLIENYTVSLITTGTLPSPLEEETTYFVSSTGLTDTEFSLTEIRNGADVITSTAGSGTHSYSMEGLTKTNLRENYDYVDLTVYQPGEYIDETPTGLEVESFTQADPAVFTLTDHGFLEGDVIKFTVTPPLDGAPPSGLSIGTNYHVLAGGLTSSEFTVSLEPDGTPTAITGPLESPDVLYVGKVTGRAGDTTVAVVGVGGETADRITGSKFVYLGEEYIITRYDSEAVTNGPYARLNLDRPLEDSLINFASSYTIKTSVATRSTGSIASLTIRISLTRVTSHDLLEIGTGSYADTNYPNEIYGPSVNPVNASNEAEERDVGRVFYVTTDQFGNFSVGPYFRVDQGTGTVTFASSIALSNLDGIGFKRGVPISEFSTDSSFSDNFTDTVPTENATRIYIERRLGVSHTGADVPTSQLIPSGGGFMSLTGQLAMKGSMNLGSFAIENLADPSAAQDAVNLRSLTYDNFQDFAGTSIERNDIIVFTGTGSGSVNASVTGDVAFTLTTGAENTVNIQLNPDTIINADVKSDAAIVQSKLLMNSATVRVNATGIVQADRGLASFNSSQFNATNGWIDLKNNGITIDKIVQVSGSTVLGNQLAGTGDITAVTFSTVVNDGFGVKKSQFGQFGTATGFLRRLSSGTSDAVFTTVEASSTYTDPTDNGKIITRTGTPGISGGGDFGGRDATLRRVIVSPGSSADDSLSTSSSVAIAGWTIGGDISKGYTRFYGYNSTGGMLVFTGTGTNKTDYWNDSHNFRTQDGNFAAPITASSVQCTALTTGGNTTSGTITGRWTLTGSSPSESRLQATYSADLAEYYEGDKEYEVGTVLVFGGDKEVTLTNIKGDTRVAGVVSNTAAFVMYDACPGFKNLVALQGRVPCKVVGKIKKGDMLVTSGIAGVAVTAGTDVKVGTVVGKALVDYDSDHIGTIEIAVGRT